MTGDEESVATQEGHASMVTAWMVMVLSILDFGLNRRVSACITRLSNIDLPFHPAVPVINRTHIC